MAEHECEANGIKQNSAKARIYNALYKDVHRFTRPTKAGLKHGESDLHPENEERRNQRPHRVHWVHNICCFDLGSAGLSINMRKEQACHYRHYEQHYADAEDLASQYRSTVSAPFRFSQSATQS